MAGFGGSTGVSKGYVDGAIAQSTATLDSHIKAHNLGNITTLSAFQSALDSMVSGITGVGFYEYMFTAYFSGAGFTPFNISNSQVFGSLTIAGENRYNIMLYNHANIDNMWRGTKLLTTWSWTKIANEQSTADAINNAAVNNASSAQGSGTDAWLDARVPLPSFAQQVYFNSSSLGPAEWGLLFDVGAEAKWCVQVAIKPSGVYLRSRRNSTTFSAWEKVQ